MTYACVSLMVHAIKDEQGKWGNQSWLMQPGMVDRTIGADDLETALEFCRDGLGFPT